MGTYFSKGGSSSETAHKRNTNSQNSLEEEQGILFICDNCHERIFPNDKRYNHTRQFPAKITNNAISCILFTFFINSFKEKLRILTLDFLLPAVGSARPVMKINAVMTSVRNAIKQYLIHTQCKNYLVRTSLGF